MARRFDRCIGGYAGCGNLGDDAILLGYLGNLTGEERRRTVVLSGSPRCDGRRFGVRCVGRKSPLAVVISFMRSRCFLLGGGSLLQNGTGNLSLLYYLGLLRLARICGCSTELLAAGIGPLRGRRAIRWVVSELKKCRFIYLRDANSARLLAEWGISRSKMAIVPDPARYLRPPAISRRHFLLRELGFYPFTSYYCVVLRPPVSAVDDCVCVISQALRVLCRQNGCVPIFLLFDAPHDGAITSRVCRAAGGAVARLRAGSAALALISGCRGLLSMRLHGLILANSLGIPSVAVSPDPLEPKLAAFCLDHSIPHLAPSQVTVKALVELMGWG